MTRVAVQPKMIRWARERADLTVEDLSKKFPKLAAWERGEAQPTFKQIEAFSKATYVPFGYLFLPEPPEEPLPIPDFRTVSGKGVRRPSPDLLDTIYAMQRRQSWLRETLVETEAEPLEFVGSARLADDPEAIGREMRRIVGLDDGWAAEVRTWHEAVSELRRAMERLGVMAVINGVVGNNTHRPLNVGEFRGFALSDSHAPLVFVNGADAKSAQMFTLAHELAHLWVGKEGLSGFKGLFPGGTDVEDWCNRAAAEFLVPERDLRARWSSVKRAASPFEVLAREFKVSPIVAARRALDLRLIGRDAFFDFYDSYVTRERKRAGESGGGDFYNNQNTRVGERFARHVFRAALEGRIGFKEAYELTGLHGGAFQEYARRLGFNLP
ncbi:MAG TPA: XRE family transcriptional regulator [Planctomycetota bacterium]|nr:XRE family transcriptional regulator [Planctomycetota bacterium]